jgi:putative transposase
MFVSGGYYHLYNRGVNKLEIFLDQQDYNTHLRYIATLLLPKDEEYLRIQLANPQISGDEREQIKQLLRLRNFNDEITLIAYCLMPNHFHFLVRQHSKRSIEDFMRSLLTRYVMYFNKRYKRVGPLFQSKYKAVLVKSDNQLRYLTKYIHRNPLKRKLYKKADVYQALRLQPSSYSAYIDKNHKSWIHPELIINQENEKSVAHYRAFIEESNMSDDLGFIKGLTLDL